MICISAGKGTGVSIFATLECLSGLVKCHTANPTTITASSNAAPNKIRFCLCDECAAGNGTSTEAGINSAATKNGCGRVDTGFGRGAVSCRAFIAKTKSDLVGRCVAAGRDCGGICGVAFHQSA